MLTIWRLTKTKYLASAWDGEGARVVGGRWNSVGTPVVYTSATLSLALVETLVHLPSGVLPAYTAIPIELDESLVTILESLVLPTNWRDDPPPASTQALGDAWVFRAEGAALKVPSVVVPEEFNYVLNPNHADFARASIGLPRPFPFDPRLVVP
ncbi:MAG: RES family NAD+ phosphorylase [Thermoanaerobaculia bacterium]|nr:RES family NAD+ phosphorylase [Thermoanaerobaculia bacterium]